MSSIRHALPVLTLALVACAHEQTPPPQDRVVLAVASPEPLPQTAFQAEPPTSRPRLSQTVTLGSTDSGYSQPSAPVAPGGQPTVVVNNNIVVYAGQPAVYGGYYYGGGYGGYGGTVAPNTGYAGHAANGAFAGGGYGARGPVTAAPGHTPGVGGNWAPAASHGPRSMR